VRDLVETVIDGVMQRERMQQASRSQSAKTGLRAPDLTTPKAPHGVGKQLTIQKSNEPKDPELWKASKQFEAIFLQQMMGEMRSTVSKSEFMPHGYAEDVHASMMDEAIAQASIKQGSVGIADAIYRQLQAGSKTQAIPNPADTLNMAEDLSIRATTEANRDAH